MGALLAVAAYMLCSSTALIANKVAISHYSVPGALFVLQIVVTVLFIRAGAALRLLAADALDKENVKIFVPYICSFVLSLYSNGRALAAANVETVIVFRACSPLLVSILDWFFLGRELPNLRSLAALLGVVGGAIGYVCADSDFAVKGIRAYFWVTVNLLGIVFEMTYGKRLISKVKFESPVWGAVLYTNALALLPMLCTAALSGELARVPALEVSPLGTAWVAVSCVIGVGISWSGWNCRSKISATAYTLLGVVCKFLSVFINMLLWDKHATGIGLVMLSLCLVSSSVYQQAPMRAQKIKDELESSANAPSRTVLGAAEAQDATQEEMQSIIRDVDDTPDA
uniref:Sugar phosphate transporter domain-containing protein n=1 Tax=Zooxanthella nutricula TaxID=1333877 RepID=A0A7S2QIU6_9DINO